MCHLEVTPPFHFILSLTVSQLFLLLVPFLWFAFANRWWWIFAKMISRMIWQKAVNSNSYDSGVRVSLSFHWDNLFCHHVTDLLRRKTGVSSTLLLLKNIWNNTHSSIDLSSTRLKQHTPGLSPHKIVTFGHLHITLKIP